MGALVEAFACGKAMVWRRLLPVVALAMVVSPPAAAQQVDMTVQPQGERLIVQMRVPTEVLSAAQLPRLPDGTLDDAANGAPLQIVAADIARNLDLRQGDTALPVLATTAAVGSNRTSVDVALTYGLRSQPASISARVNAIQSTRYLPVRTVIEFRESGSSRTMIVAGPPARVIFDPSAFETAKQFVAAALNAVLAAGDHLLMLACLLVVPRLTRETGRLMAVALVAQLLGLVGWSVVPQANGAVAVAGGMAAASLVVMAAIENVLRARLAYVLLTAAVFGGLNGLAFGDAFLDVRAFAGAHTAVALLVFVTIVAIGQLWLGGVFWLTRRWAESRISGRVLVMVVSLLCAHTALHHVAEWADALSQIGAINSQQAVAVLVAAWAGIMAIAALIEARRHRAGESAGPASGRVRVS